MVSTTSAPLVDAVAQVIDGPVRVKIVIAAIAVAFLVGLVWVGMRRERRILSERFSDRQSLDFETYYQRYCPGKLDRIRTEEILRHVAEELSIPMDKLLPSDRFDVELKPLRGWEFDSGKGILMIELQNIAPSKGKSIDIEKIVTLSDYLAAMAEVY